MKDALSTYWRNLAEDGQKCLPDLLLLALLIPFSWLYALIQRVRASLYLNGILKTGRLPRPVISIGNITVGGVGKTPVTALIARHLIERGLKVAVLSRGYGGSREGQTVVVSDGAQLFSTPAECGDEPYLLARTVPGLMVIIGPDRTRAGLLALEQLAPDVFLLDDGFQHLRLQRDLNILLLDSERPFGNGWTLPAGILREPLSAALRADFILFTRCAGPHPQIDILAKKPCSTARHLLLRALPLTGGDAVPLGSLAGARIVAFAGIARPEPFFSALRQAGLNLVAGIGLADHAVYGRALFEQIRRELAATGADTLITTEKDAVKLGGMPTGLRELTFAAQLEIELAGEEQLMAAIDKVL